jgi:hypothetical protein
MVVTVNHLYALRTVLCTTCLGAEAVRGWRALNCPMVCIVGAVAPGAGFLRFKTRVSQVHSKGGYKLYNQRQQV